MNEREWLLQRFVDHDLPPDERLAFVEALDRDPQLRRRLIQLERLVAEGSRLPQLSPGRDFATRVLARAAPERPGLLAGLREWLLAPHDLHWNLAGAAAAACVLAVSVWGLGRWTAPPSPSSPPGEPAPAVADAKPIDSQPQVLVQLVLVQPGARSVAVAGDFNGWNPERSPLREVKEGVWSGLVPVSPGRHEYMYIVDGRDWVTDPYARDVRLDGFGSKNAVLDVHTPL